MSSQLIAETSEHIVSNVDVIHNNWKIGTKAVIFDNNRNYECQVLSFTQYPTTYESNKHPNHVIFGRLQTQHKRRVNNEVECVTLDFIIQQNKQTNKTRLLGKRSISNVPNSSNDTQEHAMRDFTTFSLERIFNPHSTVNQLVHHTKIRIEAFVQSLRNFQTKHNNGSIILSKKSKVACDDNIYWLLCCLAFSKTDEGKLNEIHRLIETITNETKNNNNTSNNSDSVSNTPSSNSLNNNSNDNNSTNNISTVTNPPPPKKKKPKKIFKCDYCLFTTKSGKPYLLDHIRTEHDDKTENWLQCNIDNICSLKFPDAKSLKSHQLQGSKHRNKRPQLEKLCPRCKLAPIMKGSYNRTTNTYQKVFCKNKSKCGWNRSYIGDNAVYALQ
eukprot:248556_1